MLNHCKLTQTYTLLAVPSSILSNIFAEKSPITFNELRNKNILFSHTPYFLISLAGTTLSLTWLPRSALRKMFLVVTRIPCQPQSVHRPYLASYILSKNFYSVITFVKFSTVAYWLQLSVHILPAGSWIFLKNITRLLFGKRTEQVRELLLTHFEAREIFWIKSFTFIMSELHQQYNFNLFITIFLFCIIANWNVLSVTETALFREEADSCIQSPTPDTLGEKTSKWKAGSNE